MTYQSSTHALETAMLAARKAFGYEGPSAHLGGYVNRGFNDLDWLPDPPIALDPAAGSHHR